MKLSVMMLVFNTKSILPKNMLQLSVENILPFSDDIILVEGATKATTHYFDGNTESFTKDGKSNDGTIDDLKDLERKYPDKVKVIYSKGFYNGKTEMCNECSKIAKNEYILQKDSDEFYHHKDMESIICVLENDKPDSVHFYANHFVGGFDKVIDETNGQRWGNDIPWMRIFKHIPGVSRWMRHEPPTYKPLGTNIISKDRTLSMGIKMFHYSYVHKPQFEFKEKFYGNPEYMRSWNRYEKTGEMEIFGIKPKPFIGEHPEIIEKNYIL